MTQLKQYVQALLSRYKVEVPKEQVGLFDAFVQDGAIAEAFEIIKQKQGFIMDKWIEKALIDNILTKHIVLPNGRVGKDYAFTFDFDKLGLQGIGEHRFEYDKSVGLDFDEETHTFSGKPKTQGEHEISLFFRLEGQPSGEVHNVEIGEETTETIVNYGDGFPHEKKMKLIINPDPKSLWKDLDSDHDDPYWQPDNISYCEEFGDRHLVIGSKRGRSHAHEGRFRDDGFGATWLDSGWGVVAVADGAGSAKYSRKGSEIACKTVLDFFRNNPEKLQEIEAAVEDFILENSEDAQKALSAKLVEHLGGAAFLAQNKIKEEAMDKGAEMRDFSTTLIFAIVKKFGGKYVISSFWIGDGGIGIYDKNSNEVTVLGTPDSGEFAGQTRFLTMSDTFANGAYAKRIRFKMVEDFTALVLMTDGITDPKFQTDANLGRVEIWNQFWDDIGGKNDDNCQVDFSQPIHEVEKSLMNWMDFWSPGNHDDRTIAILY